MPAIRLLPESVVNRIAAGEVIERPSAVVKELVENALDSGASRIVVALEGGGIGRIEVADNGCGMDAGELALAVQRHATSKLPGDDLVRIATLGFRGEALPSIGAAARLAITSRSAGAPHAQSIRVEGGQVFPVMPSAGTPGTRVTVRDLFFATPARRKFLKHPRSEAEHAETVLRRLALAAPAVALRLESDKRTVFDLPGQDRAARAAALFGPEVAAVLLSIQERRGVLQLSGLIASPAVTRATAAHQALTVNGRPVADPVLKTALRVATRDVIVAGRHPVAALWLDLPAEELDVNVHPTKAELRFRDPTAVRGLVIGAIGRALAGAAGVAVPAHRPALALTPQRSPAGGIRSLPLPGLAEAQLALAAPPAARSLPVADLPDRPDHPLGAAIGQVQDVYIVAVAADGSLILVDQHAAHERLTHEALREQMLVDGVRGQPLLVPAVIDLPHADVTRLVAHAADFATLGLELEAFGPGAVLVRALPAVLGAPDPAPLIRDLADELAELDETMVLAARLDAVIARMACHGSIRAGRRLSQAEMDALLRRMEATPRAATCSHGRPTVLRFTPTEMAALFRRGA
jgi:DNA mismatch repair protein MutL